MSYLLPIFIASIRSVGTACTMASVGVYLHQRGFIVGNGKRTLALISQQVTIPAFLFTKIVYCNQDWSDLPCPDIINDLNDVWILLIWPAFVVFCGIAVGYIAARLSNTPKEQYHSVLAACAFGNSTGLPITLLTVIHANFSQSQELGATDPTLFLSVYLLLYPVLQWAIGGWMLAPSEDFGEQLKYSTKSLENGGDADAQIKATDSSEIPQNIAIPEQQTTPPPPPPSTYQRLSSFTSPVRNVLNNKSAQTFYKTLRRGISETDASLYISNADLIGMAVAHTDREQEIMANTIAAALRSSTNAVPPPPESNGVGLPLEQLPESNSWSICEETLLLNSSKVSKYIGGDDSSHGSNTSGVTTKINETSLLDTFYEIFSRCLQPPVVGAVLGLLVASTRLRGIFVDLVNRADAAQLEWIFDGLYSIGQAAVPINMIILGCNLSASTLSKQSKYNSNLLSNQTMVAIVIGKMVVMPIIGMISCFLLSKFYPLSEAIDESFYLVCMIVFITPTANNVMVMVELSGSGTKEGIARVIGWQYAVAPIILSVTVTTTVGMAILLNK